MAARDRLANRSVESDSVGSVWRAVAAFRAVSCVVCLFLIVRWQHIYARPALALAVGAAMLVVTAAVVVCAVARPRHLVVLVAADLVATTMLTVASIPVQFPSQRHGPMPTLTTIWAAGPVIEAALIAGWTAGLLAATAQFGSAMIVRGGYDGRTLNSGVLLAMVGLTVGYTTSLLARSERQLETAAAQAAALAEREAMAREIHDDVLQILALTHRNGTAAGGEWAVLGAAAAEAEISLRRLAISAPPLGDAPPNDAARNGAGRGGAAHDLAAANDLAAALRDLGTNAVTVSVPAEPVMLDAHAASELTAAVRAALHNVDRHAGPDAHTWVFLERDSDGVRISVRDNGVGFLSQRLDIAEAEGRLGISKSIRGRVESIGGTARVTAAPGEGTEIELALAGPVHRKRK